MLRKEHILLLLCVRHFRPGAVDVLPQTGQATCAVATRFESCLLATGMLLDDAN